MTHRNGLGKHSFPVMETALHFQSCFGDEKEGATNLQTVQWSHSVCSAEACSLCKDRGYDLLPGLDEAYKVCKTIRFQSIIKREKMSFFFERSVFGITYMWI